MNVTCSTCQTVFRVDPAKIPAAGVRARCSVCAGVFWVRRAPEPAPVPTASSEPVEGRTQVPLSGTPLETATPRSPVDAIPQVRPVAAEPQAVAEARVPPPPVGSPRVAPLSMQPPAVPPTEQARGGPPPVRAPSGRMGPAIAPAGPNPSLGSAPAIERPSVPLGPPPAVEPSVVQPPSTRSGPPIGAPGSPRPTAPPPPASSISPLPPGEKKRRVNPFLSQNPEAKARRLARALISDMVVYHPAKRREGLQHGSLKSLFEEEIKKSWEEYVDQVGKDVAESTPFFHDALNEILADGRPVFP